MPLDEAIAVTAEKKLQEAFGSVTLPFTHRSLSPQNIVCRVKSYKNEVVEENNALIEQRILTLKVIAGQVGFAIPTNDSEPVVPGDSWLYINRVHEVMSNGIDIDSSSQVYTLRCVERKRASHGVV